MRYITADEFAEKLCYIKVEQATFIYNNTKDQLPDIINTAYDFYRVLEFLTNEQRIEVYNSLKNKIHKLIKDAYDLAYLLRNLPIDIYNDFLSKNKKIILTIFSNTSDIPKVFTFLTPSQKIALYSNTENILLSLCDEFDSIINIFCGLDDKSKSILYKLIKPQLIWKINNIDELRSIIDLLDIDDQYNFINSKNENIKSAVQNINDFVYLTSNSSLEVTIEIYKICRLNIINSLEESKDVKNLFCAFIRGEEHPAQDLSTPNNDFLNLVLSDIKSNLKNLLVDISDFEIIVNTSKYLGLLFYENLYDYLSDYVITVIRNDRDLKLLKTVLSNKEIIDVCNRVLGNKKLIKLHDSAVEIIKQSAMK